MNNLFNLQDQVNALSKKIRCSAKILYSDGALSGPAGCYVFGIDKNTGDIYFKNDAGDWEIIIVGGGGGIFDATVDFDVNANPNDPGTTFNPNTPELTDVIYVSVINASQWTWNGSTYVLYIAPYWDKVGNVGTSAGTNFIGTRDNVALVVKTNNIERARFNTTGSLKLNNYGSGTFTGTAVRQLQVDASGNVIEGSLTNPLSWNLLGNTGTTAGTNFVGTTDAQNLVFKTNGTTRMTILSAVAVSNNMYTMAGGDATINFLTVGAGKGNVIGNTVLGVQALANNTSAGANTVVGYQSMFTANAATAVNNVSVGYLSMYSGTSARRTVSVGYRSLLNVTTGQANVVVGAFDVSGDLLITTGSLNTLVGYNVAKFHNGTGNSAFGTAALSGFSGGPYASSYNSAFGYEALFNCQANNYNVGIGKWSGYSLTTGNYNIFLGSNDTIGYPGITTGSYNVVIGNNITGLSTTLANNIVIGDGQGNIRLQIDNAGKAKMPTYGSGTHGGAATYALSVDSSGNVIETTPALTSATFIDEEVPSGTMDSVNATFNLANTPIAGSVKLYLRGLRLKNGTGYTISGTTITMLVIPDSGDELVADYRI